MAVSKALRILRCRPQPDEQEVSVGCSKMAFCFCNAETIQACSHARYFASMCTEESLLEVSWQKLEGREHMKSPQDNASLYVKTRLPEATCRQRKDRDRERKGWRTMRFQIILFSCLVSLWRMRIWLKRHSVANLEKHIFFIVLYTLAKGGCLCWMSYGVDFGPLSFVFILRLSFRILSFDFAATLRLDWREGKNIPYQEVRNI